MPHPLQGRGRVHTGPQLCPPEKWQLSEHCIPVPYPSILSWRRTRGCSSLGQRPASSDCTAWFKWYPRRKHRGWVLHCTQKSCSGLDCLLPGAAPLWSQGCHSPLANRADEQRRKRRCPLGATASKSTHLTEQPAPQAPKCVHLKPCAENQH